MARHIENYKEFPKSRHPANPAHCTNLDEGHFAIDCLSA
jgi:hypothetical protein